MNAWLYAKNDFVARLQTNTLFLATVAHSALHAQPSIASSAEVVVGIKDTPPFAMKGTDGAGQGISTDLWRRVAA
jgi:polar amino acid transport system substrate-binding protein